MPTFRPIRTVLAFLLLAGLPLPALAAGTDQPYAGLETRAIKALPEGMVADLLAGRGAGFALAAELNGYPGPAHVLALADDLALTATQRARVEAAFDAMRDEAADLGARLVALEAELDAAFADRSIDAARLSALAGDIAAVRGALRTVHLAAHLEIADVLTGEQAARYARLRGYAEAPAGGAGHSGHRHGHH